MLSYSVGTGNKNRLKKETTTTYQRAQRIDRVSARGERDTKLCSQREHIDNVRARDTRRRERWVCAVESTNKTKRSAHREQDDPQAESVIVRDESSNRTPKTRQHIDRDAAQRLSEERNELQPHATQLKLRRSTALPCLHQHLPQHCSRCHIGRCDERDRVEERTRCAIAIKASERRGRGLRHAALEQVHRRAHHVRSRVRRASQHHLR